jgi:anaerobic dimethyl sulfoxide reductase subunit B (iron-sulfur subunit)
VTQYGFFIDLSRCIGCHACEIACKQWHNIDPGPVKWLRVFQWESGTFPDIGLHELPVMCLHCQNPPCVKSCPHQALRKEEKYGAVLVDAEKCTGDGTCWKACPYGVPQFISGQKGRKMSKCNMCLDRLEKGQAPICILSCSMRALEFGPLDELRKKFGPLKQLDFLPANSLTQPSVVFKPAAANKQIIPWDKDKALRLWQKRHPDQDIHLPDVIRNMDEISQAPPDLLGRTKLVLKPRNAEEMLFYTTDDE